MDESEAYYPASIKELVIVVCFYSTRTITHDVIPICIHLFRIGAIQQCIINRANCTILSHLEEHHFQSS